jgi:hypothetical protein
MAGQPTKAFLSFPLSVVVFSSSLLRYGLRAQAVCFPFAKILKAGGGLLMWKKTGRGLFTSKVPRPKERYETRLVAGKMTRYTFSQIEKIDREEIPKRRDFVCSKSKFVCLPIFVRRSQLRVVYQLV